MSFNKTIFSNKYLGELVVERDDTLVEAFKGSEGPWFEFIKFSLSYAIWFGATAFYYTPPKHLK